MSKTIFLANIGRSAAKNLLTPKNISQKCASFQPKKRDYSAYYGEPSEYKQIQENVLLVSEENSKWKQIPGNCNSSSCQIT